MRVIFDLDGTLVNGHDVDWDCFLGAIRATLGVDGFDTDWSHYAVVTDLGIVDGVAWRTLGRGVTPEERERFRLDFPERLGAAIATTADAFPPTPGAAALLDALGKRWGVATGNVREAARVKMAAAGLARWDAPVVCSEDAADRMGLVAGCAARLGGEGRVVSVGDGVWDVDAARALGVPFVGVATGAKAEKLWARGARHVVPDFADLDGMLALLETAEPPR